MTSLSVVCDASRPLHAVVLQPERSGYGRRPLRDRVHASIRRFEAGSIAGRNHDSQVSPFSGSSRPRQGAVPGIEQTLGKKRLGNARRQHCRCHYHFCFSSTQNKKGKLDPAMPVIWEFISKTSTSTATTSLSILPNGQAPVRS